MKFIGIEAFHSFKFEPIKISLDKADAKKSGFLSPDFMLLLAEEKRLDVWYI